MNPESALLVVIAVSVALHVMVQVTFLARCAFRTAPRRGGEGGPLVSILKPIAGLDDDLAANLESFARLRHSRYEILIGIASPHDRAWLVARSFVASHPELPIRLVATDPDAANNPKVAQLIGLTAVASGPVIVVSDANVRVAPDYLDRMLAELEQPGVGLVSSAVVGTGEKSLGAALENVLLVSYVLPNVVAAPVLAGRVITIGKSMMMRRADLEELGGWRSVGNVLAEDDVLGMRFRRSGRRVRVCLAPIENPNVRCSLRKTLGRHTRWAKLRRNIHPVAFAFEPLLSPVLIASLAAMMCPTRALLQVLAVSFGLQLASAMASLVVARRAWPSVSVIVAAAGQPFAMMVCWIGAWVSNRVVWRGHSLQLGPGTALVEDRGRERGSETGECGMRNGECGMDARP